MAEKPKIVLLKEEQVIIKPGEQTQHVGSVFSNDPDLTPDQITEGFGQMGIVTKPGQKDPIGRELNKRGFGLSQKARNHYSDIFGHN